jgi:hypothetical protein
MLPNPIRVNSSLLVQTHVSVAIGNKYLLRRINAYSHGLPTHTHTHTHIYIYISVVVDLSNDIIGNT